MHVHMHVRSEHTQGLAGHLILSAQYCRTTRRVRSLRGTAAFQPKMFLHYLLVLLASTCLSGTHAWRRGRATWYDDAPWMSVHSGSCMYGYLGSRFGGQNNWHVAAISEGADDFSQSCGCAAATEVSCKIKSMCMVLITYTAQCSNRPQVTQQNTAAMQALSWFKAGLATSGSRRCYEVKCVPGSFSDGLGHKLDRSGDCKSQEAVTIAITDKCPCAKPENAYSNKRWCCNDMPHFDLGVWAFRRMADPGKGVIMIDYRPVPCPSHFNNGINTGVQKPSSLGQQYPWHLDPNSSSGKSKEEQARVKAYEGPADTPAVPSSGGASPSPSPKPSLQPSSLSSPKPSPSSSPKASATPSPATSPKPSPVSSPKPPTAPSLQPSPAASPAATPKPSPAASPVPPVSKG